MNKITLMAALIGVSATSLFATTDYAFLDNVGGGVTDSHGEYVSPYGGGLSTDNLQSDGLNVPLYCDDLSDTASVPSSWQANVTGVLGGEGQLIANTRYGANVATGFNTTFPSATTLYEELAWLFTQDSGASNSTLADIQDAAWTLTLPQGNHSAPTSSAITAWINDAQNYYNADQSTLPTGFVQADYSKWAVVTDVNIVGQVTGGGNQEFLTYIPSGNGPNGPLVPEPATFLLFGTGLLAAGLYGRRRKQSNS